MVFAHLNEDYNPKQLFLRSDWEPDPNTVPIEFRARISYFLKCLAVHYRRRQAPKNLTHFQIYLLSQFVKSDDFQIFPSDKNLGPCIIERTQYIHRVLDHLADRTTYEQLTPNEAASRVRKTYDLVDSFLLDKAQDISYRDQTYLCRSLEVKDKFAHFYIMAKVHKSPWTVRPIVSVSGSLTHGLGRWLDQQLKPIVQLLPSYIASSFDLKKRLGRLTYEPSKISLFTSDAVSMYTNIDTDHALAVIATFLRTSPRCAGVPHAAIIHGLEILMRNNIFQFGDTFWHQKQGTAMGTPPAPPYATLYFAIHELNFVPRHDSSLLDYSRYIDDVLGVWFHHPDPETDRQNFLALQDSMNGFGKLKWEFTPLGKTVHFMDLVLRVTPRGIETSIYEKPLNLYLYIPPHSAHAPGILTGLVFGMMERIFCLTTHWRDQKTSIRNLFLRLCNRGYSSTALKPIFAAALDRIENRPLPPDPWDEEVRCYLHLPFHPHDPKSTVAQRLFRHHMLAPTGEPTLDDLKNFFGVRPGTNRMIVAYHRPDNLRTLLFPRLFQAPKGRPVSSFTLDPAPAAEL
jgi:hypothetical protein